MKRFPCFGSYAFDSYICFRFIRAIHSPHPAVVLGQVELCALVEPHWLQLGLLCIEVVLAGRYIEINRALHRPVSFPGYKESESEPVLGFLKLFNVVANSQSSVKNLVQCSGVS